MTYPYENWFVMKKVNIGLVGAGTIGSGVIQILKEGQEKILSRSGLKLNLKAVCDLHVDRIQGLVEPQTELYNDYSKITSDPDIDVVVELIGGTGVAYSVAESALKNGKTLVTANKALISEKGESLFTIAQEKKVEIGYEAAVGGTIPVIRSMKTGLVTNEFSAIYGILNGTTNYILSKMELEGLNYETALKNAQDLGFAEKDPTFDVEGIDAAHKISILGGLATGKRISIDKIYIEGITKISSTEIRFAREFGYRIKLLGVYKVQGNLVEARVHPTLVPIDHPIASVMNEVNAIFFDTNYSGPVMLVGKGAGSLPTANAVLSDIVFYAARRKGLDGFSESNFSENASLLPIGETTERFYIRFNTIDKPGVLAELARVLGKNNISISSMKQAESREGQPVEVIIFTHEAKEKDLRSSIEEIDKMDITREPSVVIRIENLG